MKQSLSNIRFTLPMQRATSKPHPLTNPKRGETRFPGIKRHAETLGVSRPHLFLVLTGKRTSESLSRRYAELIRSERKTRKAA